MRGGTDTLEERPKIGDRRGMVEEVSLRCGRTRTVEGCKAVADLPSTEGLVPTRPCTYVTE